MEKYLTERELLHPNGVLSTINHVKVFHQYLDGTCGFHMVWNARCFLMALTSENLEDQRFHIDMLNCRAAFWNYHNSAIDMLLKCNDPNYVMDFDKKELAEDIRCPLDRQHLEFFILHDPVLSYLKNNKKIKLYITPIFQSFGLIQVFDKSTI